MKAYKVFQFLRGAIRSTYGNEDLRNRDILIVGMSAEGQQLLNRLCIAGVKLKFIDQNISNYHKSFAICKEVDVYNGASADVVVDFPNDYIFIKDRTFSIDDIGENAYIQGIHEFYN